MRFRIVQIGELVQDDAFSFAGHLLGEVAGDFHGTRWDGDVVGAVGEHCGAAFRGHVGGHDEGELVAYGAERSMNQS